MKRLERNATVRGLVTHWARLLTEGQKENLFVTADERIVFGQLATVTVDARSMNERG